jgi:large subunit ribosomal protein L3
LVRVDAENGVLLIKGALPGANGGLLYVRKSVTAKEKATA